MKKKIKLVSDLNKINMKKNFVFVALNLSFISFFCRGTIKLYDDIHLWCDGIMGKILYGYDKIAGSNLIKLFYKYKYSKILVVGNCNNKQIEFLKKKFKTKVECLKIPKIRLKEVKDYIPVTNRNTLILITLPTPKQEVLAYEISKINSNYKIICIGGGLDIATGIIKSCPKLICDLGLEFLWRLRTDTIRRLNRLIYTGILFLYYFLTGEVKKIKITKL